MSRFNELYNRLPKELRDKLEACRQHPKYHPEGNVDQHIKLVFEYAEKHFPGDMEILLAALFHDLGKPETFSERVVNGELKISAYGHEFRAKNFILKHFDLFKDISTDQEKVEEICYNHMKAAQYTKGTLKKAHKRKAFEDLKHFDAIIKFAECDKAGKKAPGFGEDGLGNLPCCEKTRNNTFSSHCKTCGKPIVF
jgi:HD domain-containing protein